MTTTFFAFAFGNLLLPYVLSVTLTRFFTPTTSQYTLIKAFSLLLLGMFLSALATLNFSLSFLVGLLCAPLTFIRPTPEQRLLAVTACVLLGSLGPTAVLLGSSIYWNVSVRQVLVEAAFAWDVWGLRTQVVVWCVWWPAWLISSVLVASSLYSGGSNRE